MLRLDYVITSPWLHLQESVHKTPNQNHTLKEKVALILIPFSLFPLCSSLYTQILLYIINAQILFPGADCNYIFTTDPNSTNISGKSKSENSNCHLLDSVTFLIITIRYLNFILKRYCGENYIDIESMSVKISTTTEIQVNIRVFLWQLFGQAYSEACQTSTMERLAKIANVTNFTKALS